VPRSEATASGWTVEVEGGWFVLASFEDILNGLHDDAVAYVFVAVKR
jgi:hypothetical protein